MSIEKVKTHFISDTKIKPEDLSETTVGQQLCNAEEIRYKKSGGYAVSLSKLTGTFPQIGYVEYYLACGLEPMNSECNEFQVYGSCFFPVSKKDEAVNCFVMMSRHGVRSVRGGYSLDEVSRINKETAVSPLPDIGGVFYISPSIAVIDEMYVRRTSLSFSLIDDLLKLGKEVRFEKSVPGSADSGIVFIPRNKREKLSVDRYRVYALSDINTTDEDDTLFLQHFPVEGRDEAIRTFMRRTMTGRYHSDPWPIERLRVKQYGLDGFTSYYNYCDVVLEAVWLEVFGKTPSDMYAAGIVSAHADKCSFHRQTWIDNDINVYHGTMLYLMSYMKEMKVTDRNNIAQWVVDTYPEYKAMFNRVDKKMLLEKYSYKPLTPEWLEENYVRK